MKVFIRGFRNLVHDAIIFIMPKFILTKMLSCEDIAKLLIESPQLAEIKGFNVKMHLLICQCCTDYLEQLRLIESGSQKLSLIELTDEQKEQVEKSKQKILASLPKAQ